MLFCLEYIYIVFRPASVLVYCRINIRSWCECWREARCNHSFFCSHPDDELQLLSRLFICRWSFYPQEKIPNHDARKLLISATNDDGVGRDVVRCGAPRMYARLPVEETMHSSASHREYALRDASDTSTSAEDVSITKNSRLYQSMSGHQPNGTR